MNSKFQAAKKKYTLIQIAIGVNNPFYNSSTVATIVKIILSYISRRILKKKNGLFTPMKKCAYCTFISSKLLRNIVSYCTVR